MISNVISIVLTSGTGKRGIREHVRHWWEGCVKLMNGRLMDGDGEKVIEDKGRL